MRRRRVGSRGIGLRSHFVALALTISLAIGCGNDTVTGSANNPAEGVYGYLRDLVAGEGVGDPDLVAVVSAACEAYAVGLRQRDSEAFTFDQYIVDLFAANGDGLDGSRVDRAVTAACGSFDGNLRSFVDELSDSLDVDLDELRNYMAIACDNFKQRTRGDIDGPFPPETFDPVVGGVLAKGGLDRSDLAALLNSACQDLPPPSTQPAPESDAPAVSTSIATAPRSTTSP